MLSIIIPALNEEKHLPKLLYSIAKQGLENYEIIVADNNSKDRTRKIALNHNCKVVKGGLPPVARNNGAKVAKGDLLLFLDADTLLPDKTLKRALNEFNKKNLDISTAQLKPLENNFFDKVILFLGNFGMLILQIHDPHATGSFILAKKSIHKKLGGFNEALKQAEDHDYAKRASKLGKFRVLDKVKVFTSMRRFEEEGRLRLLMKYWKSELVRKIKGNIDFDIYDYKYGHFK